MTEGVIVKNVIICCEVLKDELTLAMKKTGQNYPVIWVSSDYHQDPAKLKEKLQSEIDNIQDTDRILLGYGCCGNAIVGLKATTADLLICKVDDCIEILMRKPTQRFERKQATYFLSKGWLANTDKSILAERDYLVNRYGEKRAMKILKTMFSQYKYLLFIDSGVSDEESLHKLLDSSKQFAASVEMELQVEKSDVWFLQEFLIDQNNENFHIVSKGDSVPLRLVTDTSNSTEMSNIELKL